MPETAAERLQLAAASAAVPHIVVESWKGVPPAPAPGQLWRARWDEAACLLLLFEVETGRVRGSPVTLDTRLADSSAAILPAISSALGVTTVVWIEDRTWLPVRVLDRYLGESHVDVEPGELAEFIVRLPHGRSVRTPIDERVEHRAWLQDLLEIFATARWAPAGDGGLPKILAELSLAQVAEALGSSDSAVALRVRRGKYPVTSEQAAALAQLLGRSPERLLAGNPPLPDDLVQEFDSPAVRAKVVVLAQQENTEEIAMWQQAAYDVYGLAARQSKKDEPAWHGRIEQYFAARLAQSNS